MKRNRRVHIYTSPEVTFLIQQGRLFRSNMQKNVRQVTCRFCGKVLQKGEGIDWYKYPPTNRHFFNKIYVCNPCDQAWRASLSLFDDPTRYLPGVNLVPEQNPTDPAYPTCPKCGRWLWEAPLSSFRAECPECKHEFIVTEDSYTTLGQWLMEWHEVDEEYPDLSPFRICPKCPGNPVVKEYSQMVGYPGDEWEEKGTYIQCECGFMTN